MKPEVFSHPIWSHELSRASFQISVWLYKAILFLHFETRFYLLQFAVKLQKRSLDSPSTCGAEPELTLLDERLLQIRQERKKNKPFIPTGPYRICIVTKQTTDEHARRYEGDAGVDKYKSRLGHLFVDLWTSPPVYLFYIPASVTTTCVRRGSSAECTQYRITSDY